MNPDDMKITRRIACKKLVTGAMALTTIDMLTDQFEIDGACAAPAAPGKLPRITPGAAGIDPKAILAFINDVEVKVGGLHSFMLLRRGAVAAEGWWAPYAKEHPHMLYSLSKSFTSTAVGLAITSGKLSLDAPVTSFFPDKLPAVQSDNLKSMLVRHLLTMSTGHHTDATGNTTGAADGDWAKAFLALPVQHEPGTFFVYNSAATYMLSAIVQKVVGETVLNYLKPRLFAPIGIENPTWETCPEGINTGGWGLAIKTEDIARFGQLYLQKGKWAGAQLIPEAWVAEATTRKISNGDPAQPSDWSQGYCYQFWRCRHNAYRGDGAFGQYCVVMPEHDVVLAITSGLGDMQAVLNAVWDRLLPGIQIEVLEGANDEADLHKRIAHLEVQPPAGKHNSSVANRVSGRTFHLEPNGLSLSSAVFNFSGGGCTASIKRDSGTSVLKGGAKGWVKGTGDQSPKDRRVLPGLITNKTAGRGAWIADNTYELKLCYYETPFLETYTFQFTGNQITINVKTNVGFGPTTHPSIVGYQA